MLRVTPPRVVYCLGVVTLLYLSVKIFSDTESTKRCDLSHEYQETLEETIGKVHLVLKKIGLTHALCYDTLGLIQLKCENINHHNSYSVGQIRLGRNLPWEDSGYFCIFNEDLVKYDEGYIGRTFQESQLDIAYDSAEGRYLVTRQNKDKAQSGSGVVKLIVFSKEREMQEVIEPTYYRLDSSREIFEVRHVYFQDRLEKKNFATELRL